MSMIASNPLNGRAFDFDALRQNNPLPEIVAATVPLKRAGNEWKACCPLHDDRTPSLTLFRKDRDWQFHCFGCGASGDVIDYVAKLHRVEVIEAVRMLGGGNLPAVTVSSLPEASKSNRTQDARRVWQSCGPIQGTAADAYLRSRGITIGLPDSLRFGRLQFAGQMRPALVAIVAGPDNKFRGVHRIFLKDDGTKADLEGGKVKFSLGPVIGGAIRLAPAAQMLTICAGLEDGLSLQQILGRAVWVATGDVGLERMALPLGVDDVVIGIDADASGERVGKALGGRLVAEGRKARLIRPIEGAKDFNQELMEGSQ